MEDGFVAALGISDPAGSRWRRSLGCCSYRLASGFSSASEYTPTIMVFSGWLARAQWFHEGASAAVEADNPYAAFTLVAGLRRERSRDPYVKDHLAKLDKFWRDPDGPGVKVGVMTNYAWNRFRWVPWHLPPDQRLRPSAPSFCRLVSHGG